MANPHSLEQPGDTAKDASDHQKTAELQKLRQEYFSQLNKNHGKLGLEVNQVQEILADWVPKATAQELQEALSRLENDIEQEKQNIERTKEEFYGRLNAWQIAPAEARVEAVKLTKMSRRERDSFLQGLYKEYLRQGEEQTERFKNLCLTGKQDKLLADSDEKIATKQYLSASYDNRKSIIARVEALIQKHREAVPTMVGYISTLPDTEYSDRDKRWLKNDFMQADGKGRRWRIRNFRKWALHFGEERKERGLQYSADIRNIPEEELSRSEAEEIVTKFLRSSSEKRREMVLKFERHRGMGQQNYRTFDGLMRDLVAEGIDMRRSEEIRDEFLLAHWDHRVRMVRDLQSGRYPVSPTGKERTAEENKRGRYFSKRFEDVIVEIATENHDIIAQYDRKDTLIRQGAVDTEILSVSRNAGMAAEEARADQIALHNEQDVPTEDIPYRFAVSEDEQLMDRDSDETQEITAEDEASRKEDMQKMTHEQIQKLDELERAGTQQIVLDQGLRRHAPNQNAIMRPQGTTLRKLFRGFRRGKQSPQHAVEALGRMRASQELDETEVRRLEEAVR